MQPIENERTEHQRLIDQVKARLATIEPQTADYHELSWLWHNRHRIFKNKRLIELLGT